MSQNSVSKRMGIEANLGVDENKNDNNIAGSSWVTSELPFYQDDVGTFIDVFTEDILPVILDNQPILTAKDLLSFRLVNRRWRDAATSVLLKRNMCRIALDCNAFIFDKEGNLVSRVNNPQMGLNGCISRFCNFHQPRSFVADLSQLISSSPKFPSTSIRLNTQGSSGHQTVKYNITTCNDSHAQDEYCPQKDLLHFFSIYGKKIKEFLLESEISEKSMQDLLYVHMPHLICLNLSKFRRYGRQGGGADWAASENLVCLPAPSTLELQEICFVQGASIASVTYNFMKNLVQVSPNLRCIKNVDVGSLGVLLQVGKFHLVHDLSFTSEVDMSTFLEFSKLLTDTIWKKTLPSFNLSKLSVQLDFIVTVTEYDSVVKALNVILSACKNSLKILNLEIHRSCRTNIIIPPLPRLECLDLVSWKQTDPLVRIYFSDVIRSVIEAGGVARDEPVYDFHALKLAKQENQRIPHHFFPRLRQVNLNLKKMGDNPRKLVHFFLLEHFGGPDKDTKIPGDTLSTVTTLKLNNFPLYASNMSTLFPNVTDLKIEFKSPERLLNSVWTTFPKLRRFEIGISSNNMLHTHVVDSFFTGISWEWCKRLKHNLTSNTKLDFDHAQVFDRTVPYIGDCENLEELTIKFGGGGWKIASKVTGVFGFQKVILRAKIIFSFEDLWLNADEIEETKQEVKLVFPYVAFKFASSNFQE